MLELDVADAVLKVAVGVPVDPEIDVAFAPIIVPKLKIVVYIEGEADS